MYSNSVQWVTLVKYAIKISFSFTINYGKNIF